MLTTLTIFSALITLGALVLAFIPRSYAPATCWAGMLLMHFSGNAVVSTGVLAWWGTAALIVLGIGYLSPSGLPFPRAANFYTTGGAVAGALVGLLAASYGLIIGAVVGAVLGAMAYMRTPQGRRAAGGGGMLGSILAVCGLPSVVTVSIAGYTLTAIMMPTI